MFSILTLLAAPAFAGSINAPGTIGGSDAGAATVSPVALHYNPAAIAAAPGVQVLADAQVAFIRVDATATRNGGIDPNTGEEYNLAKARVKVPVALIGATWQVLPDRLTVGLGVTDAFVGGGDYTAGEPDKDPPYESHQRYAGVDTAIITLHIIPAVGLTITDGIHVGASFKYIVDSFSAIQASDPLGTEGVGPTGPYSTDTVLEGNTSGGHIGYGVGVFFDGVKQAQVGISYTNNGTFESEGDGKVILPDLLGGGEQDAKLTFSEQLPGVVQLSFASQINDQLTVGGGAELQLWGQCCSDHDGDAVIGVTDANGNALVTSAGEINTTQYSPRRLKNSTSLNMNVGWQPNQTWWFGARAAYNESAVPDYAVSATNIDYESVGGYLAARAKLGKMNLGLTYGKFFPFQRQISNSAWNASEDSPDYVDEYFSPKLPYKASTNGTYTAKVDLVGVRIGANF